MGNETLPETTRPENLGAVVADATTTVTETGTAGIPSCSIESFASKSCPMFRTPACTQGAEARTRDASELLMIFLELWFML
jgi:hypothetical protein